MKGLILTLIGLLALPSPAAAQRATIPAQYAGHWCGDGSDYLRQCRQRDSNFAIDAGGTLTEDTSCIIIRIVPEGHGHRLTFRCRYMDDPGAKWERVEQRWRRKGDRLYLTTLDSELIIPLPRPRPR